MLNTSIIVAFITGAFSFLGVLIANKVQVAIIEEKIKHLDDKFDALEHKVEVHNSHMDRLVVAENEIKHLKDEIDYIEKELK